MRLYIAAVSAISRGLGVFAAILLFSAVLSVCHMVFVRYVLNQSTIWQTEYTAYAIVAATFLGSPWVLIVRGHVNVDLLQIAAARPVRLIMQLLSAFLSLVFVVLLAYAAWFYFEEAWVNDWTSETVWAVPLWMPALPMVVGTVMLALQYVAEIIRLSLDGSDEVSHTPQEAFEATSPQETRP
ncbi:TRAP transporter small permease subunit [Jiella marina]|uniref:TRAP transporter small permease subunit n=1 Tax=Jiella sp. LLJ827 TaxID=2917712 RepID=UPI002100B2A3|nr:TRAP transporter small permease [Jiella sp. LLJ827]MCQ0989103.1 TRAP transporter small permease [Jiella sp. LLJ827]